MLVIGRRPQEVLTLTLEDGRKIRVVNAGSGYARIGIEAPKTVKIRREELPELNKEPSE